MIFGNLKDPTTGQTQIGDPLARTLLQQSMNPAPMRHPLELAGRLAQFGVGTWVEKDENEGRQTAFADAWTKSGGDLAKFAELARGNPRLRGMASGIAMKVAEAKMAEDAARRKIDYQSETDLKKMGDPRYIEAQKARASRVDVSMPPAEKAADVESAKLGAKRLSGLGDDADAANKAAAALPYMEKLLERIQTGKFAETRLTVGQIGKSLGIDFGALGFRPDQIADGESLNAMMKAQITAIAKTLGANPSNYDAQLLAQTVPNFGATPDGNKQIIATMKRAIDFSRKYEKAAGAYFKKNRSMIGFAEEWAAQNPPPATNAAPQGAAPQGTNPGRIEKEVIGPDGKRRKIWTDGKSWYNEDGSPLR